MLRPVLSLFAAAAVIFASSAAIAQTGGQEKYLFDKPHTQIMFSVDHLGFTKSHGRFLDYDGFFVLDRADITKSYVDATIKVASLDMGDEKWDEHLKSPDFFDAEKFPTMTFKSTSVVKTSDNTADVTGDLTILGVTKPVVLNVVHNKSGVFPMNDKMYVAGFTATTHFKRSDFGMTKYAPMLGDDVQIVLEIQGNQDGYKGADKGKE